MAMVKRQLLELLPRTCEQCGASPAAYCVTDNRDLCVDCGHLWARIVKDVKRKSTSNS